MDTNGSRIQRMGTAAAALAAGVWLASLYSLPGHAAPHATIVDEWSRVQIPPAPTLKTVTVDPTTTAFLILDIASARATRSGGPGV